MRSFWLLSLSSTEGYGVPTSIDFVRTETSQMVASYSSAQCVIYDLETAAPVVTLDSAKTYSEYACVLLPCSIHRLKCKWQFTSYSCETVVPIMANLYWSVSQDSYSEILPQRNLKTRHWIIGHLGFQGNHMIIVILSFFKSAVSKVFSCQH